MEMLRWTSDHTLLDRIENAEIRRRTKVTELHAKVQEKRLRWYGHVLRRDEEHITSRTMEMTVEGRMRQDRPILKVG